MAEQQITSALRDRPAKVQGIVWLQAIWTPVREEEVLDPRELGQHAFQQRVYRLAHDGHVPLLAYDQGKRADASTARLRIQQGDASRWQNGLDLVIIELFANGTVSIALNVTGMQPGHHADLGALYRIEPDQLRGRLEQAWDFTARWWEQIDPYRRHDPLLIQVALYDIEMHVLEPNPGHRVTQVVGRSLYPQRPNPLLAYDRPRRIVRPDLRVSGPEMDKALGMLQMRFEETA